MANIMNKVLGALKLYDYDEYDDYENLDYEEEEEEVASEEEEQPKEKKSFFGRRN